MKKSIKVQEAIENLREYIWEDEVYSIYKEKNDNKYDDFEHFCISHCKDIETLINFYEEGQDERLKYAKEVIDAINDHLQEGGSYRCLIYGRLGFDITSGAYCELINGLNISNAFCELEELREANKKMKAKMEKARKKAILIHDIGFDYDGFNSVASLKRLIDELVSYDVEIIKTLQGENDE